MDREKVIKEFADYVHYFKPYCIGDIENHAMLKDVLSLLKEQDNCENCAIAIEDRQPIIRCRDCKYSTEPDENGFGVCMKIMHGCQSCGFYADGERQEGR